MSFIKLLSIRNSMTFNTNALCSGYFDTSVFSRKCFNVPLEFKIIVFFCIVNKVSKDIFSQGKLSLLELDRNLLELLKKPRDWMDT
jgi:hypothetical protein